jgi:CheY-like chemotaxis protein
MGGELQIHSTVGEGTTLTFQLPFVIAESVPRQTEDVPAPIALAPGQGVPRILIVDDDTDSRETYVRFLASIGVTVRGAADGKEATELVAAESPDLVFMDIRMPVMGGVEAARHIRSQEAPQPVIVAMTASVFLEEVPDILAAGCDDFLSKPFHLDKLVAMIEAHLGTRFARVEPREQPTESELLAAAKLPVGVRERLGVAVESLEVEAIDAAIAEIRELDGVFGESLASYARDYRYGAILALLRPPSADSDLGAHG